MTREELIGEAVDRCLKEIYQYAKPKVTWEDFIRQNKEYSKEYKKWEDSKNREDKLSCIGPAPYEFYYLPKDILKSICDSYIYAYKLDNHQNFLDIINILKDYCKKPIVRYIDDHTDEYGNRHPGYRSYAHPDNLEEEIQKLMQEYDSSDVSKEISEKCCNKFFEFLDMAGNFYNWNRDLNSFNVSVYLGPSPNSNKERVIKNWKEYRGEVIEIDDKEIEKEFYGEED